MHPCIVIAIFDIALFAFILFGYLLAIFLDSCEKYGLKQTLTNLINKIKR